jgi:hypothetical protein
MMESYVCGLQLYLLNLIILVALSMLVCVGLFHFKHISMNRYIIIVCIFIPYLET